MKNTRWYALPFILLITLSVCSSAFAWWWPNGTVIKSYSGQCNEGTQGIPDGTGGAIIAWVEGCGDCIPVHTIIMIQRIDPDGNTLWDPEGVALSSDTCGLSYPQLAPDGFGGAIVAWINSGMCGEEGVYAQRIDMNGNILWPEGGKVICPEEEYWDWTYRELYIFSEGGGGAIIAWLKKQDFGDWNRGAVQKIDANGNIQWAPFGVNLGPIDDNYGITTDGAGGAILAFTSWDNDSTKLYVQRVDSMGNKMWTNAHPDTMGYELDPIYAVCPKIVSDDAGGAVIAWSRTYEQINYVQRINSTGAIQWTAGGIAVSLESSSHGCPRIMSNGGGETIVMWLDSRGGVYAQKISGGGIYLWHPYGYEVCPSQYICSMTTDCAGGSIVAWPDNRSGNYDIYTQRVDTDGNILWTEDGVALCTQDSMQYSQAVIADESAGAIVVWSDKRRSRMQSELYALKVDQDGGITYAAVTETPCVYSLSQNYPNPFNPTTTIAFNLPRAVYVKLCVYNVKGELVATLVDHNMMEGRKEFTWTANDNRGRTVSSGIYFYRLVAGDFVQTKKMALLR